MPATGFLMGTPASISGQRGAADGRLAGGAVGAEHLGHAADGVRELNTGQHGQQGALGKSCRGYRSRGGLRCGRTRPRPRNRAGNYSGAYTASWAPGEMSSMICASRRPDSVTAVSTCVRPRVNMPEPCTRGQQAHFGGQRADLDDAAAVHALTLVQQPAAHHELLHLVHQFSMVAAPPLLGVFSSSLRMGEQPRVAHGLVVGVHGRLESVQIIPLHFLQQVVVQLHGLELDFWFADLSHDAVDEGDNLSDLGVAGLDGFQHGGFVHPRWRRPRS